MAEAHAQELSLKLTSAVDNSRAEIERRRRAENQLAAWEARQQKNTLAAALLRSTLQRWSFGAKQTKRVRRRVEQVAKRRRVAMISKIREMIRCVLDYFWFCDQVHVLAAARSRSHPHTGEMIRLVSVIQWLGTLCPR